MSTVYTSTTFSFEPTLLQRNSENASVNTGIVPSNKIVQQVPVLGRPQENTIDLIVRPSGFINSQGESRSKVFYYFTNTEENGIFYANIN